MKFVVDRSAKTEVFGQKSPSSIEESPNIDGPNHDDSNIRTAPKTVVPEMESKATE